MHRYTWLVAALGAAVVVLLVPAVAPAASGPTLNFYAPNTTNPPVTTYAFGAVLPGQSTEKTFTLKNTGGSATSALKISLTKIAGATGAFTKTGDTCSLPVPISLGPGKMCQITIRFAPVAGGELDKADLKAVSNKPAASQTLHLTGSGAAPKVEITPTSKDFGTAAGTSQSFTATNNGTATSGSYSFAAPSDNQHFILLDNTCTGAPLAPGDSCAFKVFYGSQSCGGGATYEDSVGLGSLASATLEAAEPACPQISVSPTSWDFGTVAGTKEFTYTNDGSEPADISVGLPGFVNLTAYNCPFTLVPGASCSLTISFAPLAGCGGSYAGTLTMGASPHGEFHFTSTAPAALIGAQPACAPHLTIDPTSWDFGTTSGTKTFTVKNDGTAAETFFFELTGSAVFGDAVGSSTCGGILQPGDACTANVDFTQLAGCGDRYSGTFLVQGAAVQATATFTAAQPACPPDLSLSPGTFRTTLANGGKVYTYPFVASATQTFTVTNTGTGATNTLTLAGGNDPGFSLTNDTCTNNALSPGGTCTFDLTFTAPTACNPNDNFTTVNLFALGTTGPVINLAATGDCPA